MDATTGQNGLRQARMFNEVAGVTGVILTKLDGTAKGGIALAIANEIGVPIKRSRSARRPRICTRSTPASSPKLCLETSSMFDTLGERLNTALDGVRGSGNLTEDQVKKVTREIRLALLEADVNYSVVKEFVGNVRERATGAEVSKAPQPGPAGRQDRQRGAGEPHGRHGPQAVRRRRPPTVVMLAGLNGHGKTTVAGKLALFVRKLGKNPYLVACDTYRPAAIDQLQQIGRELGVPVYSEARAGAGRDRRARHQGRQGRRLRFRHR